MPTLSLTCLVDAFGRRPARYCTLVLYLAFYRSIAGSTRIVLCDTRAIFLLPSLWYLHSVFKGDPPGAIEIEQG